VDERSSQPPGCRQREKDVRLVLEHARPSSQRRCRMKIGVSSRRLLGLRRTGREFVARQIIEPAMQKTSRHRTTGIGAAG